MTFASPFLFCCLDTFWLLIFFKHELVVLTQYSSLFSFLRFFRGVSYSLGSFCYLFSYFWSTLVLRFFIFSACHFLRASLLFLLRLVPLNISSYRCFHTPTLEFLEPRIIHLWNSHNLTAFTNCYVLVLGRCPLGYRDFRTRTSLCENPGLPKPTLFETLPIPVKAGCKCFLSNITMLGVKWKFSIRTFRFRY